MAPDSQEVRFWEVSPDRYRQTRLASPIHMDQRNLVHVGESHPREYRINDSEDCIRAPLALLRRRSSCVVYQTAESAGGGSERARECFLVHTRTGARYAQWRPPRCGGRIRRRIINAKGRDGFHYRSSYEAEVGSMAMDARRSSHKWDCDGAIGHVSWWSGWTAQHRRQ